MNREEYINLKTLCDHFKVEMTFFQQLNDVGLIEWISIEEEVCIHEGHIANLERIIRLNQELDINLEGIDTIFNLLNRIETLENELLQAKNRLTLYEEDDLF